MNNTEIEPCIIECVFWLSSIINSCSSFFEEIYENNECIHNMVDITDYTCNSCSKSIKEPMQKTWISTNFIDENKNTLIYKYTVLNDFEISQFHDYFSNINENESNKNGLIILHSFKKTASKKTDSYYICARPSGLLDIFRLEYSSIRFLSITYTNENSNPVTLVVDKEWMTIGNELLGCIHVLRMLEHQNEPFHFSLDYVLKIIDSDINVFELRRHQYLKVQKDGYHIEETIL